jgi:hypothetical protein
LCSAGSERWEAELIRGHVDHGDQVVYIAVPSSPPFCCLNQTIDAFEQTVRHSAMEPAQNAFLMLFDRLRQADHRRKLGACRPANPFP